MASAIFAQAAAAWHQCRAEYQAHLEAAYARAERETNGYLLNRAGRAAGIDSYSLFTGPHARACKYASTELLEHWAAHPRVSFTEFEHDWATTELRAAA